MGKTTRQRIKVLRQEYVSSLLLRGMSQRKITEVLATPTITVSGKEKPNPFYCVNPATGMPFNLSQINRDIKELEQRWRERSAAHVDEHRARQLAELEEVKHRAWEYGDLESVIRALTLEMKLMGTAKPEKQEHRWDDEQLEKAAGAKDKLLELLSRHAPAGDTVPPVK